MGPVNSLPLVVFISPVTTSIMLAKLLKVLEYYCNNQVSLLEYLSLGTVLEYSSTQVIKLITFEHIRNTIILLLAIINRPPISLKFWCPA